MQPGHGHWLGFPCCALLHVQLAAAWALHPPTTFCYCSHAFHILAHSHTATDYSVVLSPGC
jgi:hypothetical protein